MHASAQRDIIEAVRRRGGIVRVAELKDAGFRRSHFEAATRSGALQRVRRGWVATTGADALLVSAAKHGVVLSCITQARRLGLWVHDQHACVHVAATPGSAGGKPKHNTVHWAKPLIPRMPGALEDPIENVLAMVSECEPYEQALATWESALNKGLVSIEALRNLPLRPAARRLAAQAQPFADAGLETYLGVRLRWLKIPLRFQIWVAGHRLDALLGERLGLQIDGGTHVGPQRSEDIRHDAELTLMGYHVIRISYTQMMNEWAMVQDLLMRAVAQGLHVARSA